MTHRNGYFHVWMGQIENKEGTGIPITDPAIILDIDCGTLHKVGNAEHVKPYYDTMVAAINQIDPDLAKDLMYIVFNPKTGEPGYDAFTKASLSLDDICTIINWLFNHPNSDDVKAFFEADEKSVREKIDRLQNIGL